MTGPATPSISFIVCTRNRERAVVECVTQLLRSGRDDIEVIVRDNCSDDQTVTSLERIKDDRLHLQVAPENQGTLTFFLASKAARGGVVTWLSDEDEVDFAEIDHIIDVFNQDMNCNVVMGSVAVGRDGDTVRHQDGPVVSPDRAFVDAVSFSGCAGVFVRREALRKGLHDALDVESLEDGYRLWNYYPIGFFASRCLPGGLVKRSAVVVRQVRFAQTTNNWSKGSKAAATRPPHYYPTSVADRLASTTVNLWFEPMSAGQRLSALVRILRMFRGQASIFSSSARRELLRANYAADILEAYEAEVARRRLGTSLGRLLWLAGVLLSLPGRCLLMRHAWKPPVASERTGA